MINQPRQNPIGGPRGRSPLQGPAARSNPPETRPSDAVELSDSARTLGEILSLPAVSAVCRAHGLSAYLRQAVEGVWGFFGRVEDLRAEVDVDPDTGERRIVLDVTSAAPADELSRSYRDFTRAWVRGVPPEAREWLRLSVHSLQDA